MYRIQYDRTSTCIGIFNSILAKQNVNAQVVVYLVSGRLSYGGYYYDTLRDEDRQEEITIIVTQPQRKNLKNDNLVNVGGMGVPDDITADTVFSYGSSTTGCLNVQLIMFPGI